jgi:hypothetical protein
MALFIVRHQHHPDRCPAHDPYMGATLLNHLSRPNVRKYGITIQAEAVVRTEHTVYMNVESSDVEPCSHLPWPALSTSTRPQPAPA